MYRMTDQTKFIALKSGYSKKLSLALSGFSKQKYISVEDLANFILNIPPAHLAGIREITFQPEGLSLYPALSRPNSCLGEFVRESRRIFIYKIQSRKELLHVLCHELGHHVFTTFLTPAYRREWLTICAKSKISVSEYGRRNAEEEFSECYAHFLTDPAPILRIPAKLTFLRHKIFQT